MHKLRLPLGPWTHEPNEKHWIDPATGLHCYIRRSAELLHLCGYVGVPPGHPAYKRDYDALALNVHGGVTYADYIKSSPMPDLWWIGFDCAHAFDYSPGASYFTYSVTAQDYRDMQYVTRECTHLASQLAEYTPPMSVREALHMVLARAEANRNALTIKEESKLTEALATVREHINDLER